MKLYPQAAILLLPFKFGSSDAAIFENNKRWPVDERSSFTIIPVCITDDSSAYNNDSSIPPSLNAVVGRMRWALSQGWEQYSSLRFVGFNKCSEVLPENVQSTVRVSIKVTNENNSPIGTNARGKTINLKPWGYNCHENMRYSFECAEQYAVHEFGHAIGFLHEWVHPATPQTCADSKKDDQIISSDLCSVTYDIQKAYTVDDLSNYDWDSIMTYNDECAHVTGRRFGSPWPSEADKKVLREVYPSKFDWRNSHFVGVIPNSSEDCPPGNLVGFHLHNERGNNKNKQEGWTGASKSNPGTPPTTDLLFCLVDGDLFGSLTKSAMGNSNYAVLLLGGECPREAVPFRRRHDDEDDNNENYMFGDTGFNMQDNSRGWTSLLFCLFKESDSPSIKGLPNLGFEYGVFANNEFSLGSEYGFIITHDEDDDNQGQLTSFGSLSDDCVRKESCSFPELNKHDKKLILATAVSVEKRHGLKSGTKYNLAKVRTIHPTSSPSKFPSKTPTRGPSATKCKKGHSVKSKKNHSVKCKKNHSVKSKKNRSVKYKRNHSVKHKKNHSVKYKRNHSVKYK